MLKNTACKECIFAVYEDGTQIDCKENRLDKLKENGAELEFVTDEQGGLSYYVIRNRFCNRCVSKVSLGDTPKAKWRDVVVTMTTIRVAMVVYAGADATDEDVDNTVNSFLHQMELPYCINVVIDNDKIDRNAVINKLRNINGLMYWRVEKVNEVGWGFDKAVDYILYKTPAMYFTSCNAGYEYSPDYIEKIDHAINVDMKQIAVITPDENNNGLFTQVKLYQDVIASEGLPFVDNLLYLAKQYGQEQFILKAAP